MYHELITSSSISQTLRYLACLVGVYFKRILSSKYICGRHRHHFAHGIAVSILELSSTEQDASLFPFFNPHLWHMVLGRNSSALTGVPNPILALIFATTKSRGQLNILKQLSFPEKYIALAAAKSAK